MNREIVNTIASGTFVLVLVIALSSLCPARARDSGPSYERMAPIEQYLMTDRNTEIAFARTAAPESISRDAEVLVLGRHGYETAVKGKNGWVCVVERSWMAPFDDPEFLNPDQRLPLCLNRRRYEPICHSLSKRRSWQWLDCQELRCSTISKPHTTRRNCRCRNRGRCAI
jgi:hypothetical protein